MTSVYFIDVQVIVKNITTNDLRSLNVKVTTSTGFLGAGHSDLYNT